MAEWYDDPASLTSRLPQLALGLLLLAGAPRLAWAQVDSGNFEIRNFRFADGRQLPERGVEAVSRRLP